MNRRKFITLAGAVPAVALPANLAAKPANQGLLYDALEAEGVGAPPLYAPLTTGGMRMSGQWQAWFTKMYNAMRTGKPSDVPLPNGWRNE